MRDTEPANTAEVFVTPTYGPIPFGFRRCPDNYGGRIAAAVERCP